MSDRHLPIDRHQNTITQAMNRGHLVVTAATGSGKSTRLPVWASENSPTLVVEPRRVACTALADYLAAQSGSAPGEQVGYAIRFEQKLHPDTPLVFVTPGIALRWLSSGELKRFGTIVLDEFHERRWDTDLLLALLREQGQHRLVVTSATLATERLVQFLEAPLIEAEGRSFPVTVHHQARDPQAMPDTRGLEKRVAEAVRSALQQTTGQVLVFLPGRGEIQQAGAALSDLSVPVQTLHASVSNAEQRAALADDAQQRVILATNVAETSLTIPGVTAVVDSGLERRTHQRNGRTVLGLAPISLAAAEQRKGRAGRTGPGLCLRLWGEHAPLAQVTPPEVQREELTELVLAAACAGHPATSLTFPDPLPEKSLNKALERLDGMGALTEQGTATEHGRKLFALPIDSLYAHLISSMPDADTRATMADLTAALSVHPPLMRFPKGEQERQALQQWQPAPCDATTLITALRQAPPEPLTVNAQSRKQARRLASQIRSALDLGKIPETPPQCRQALMQAILRAQPELAFVRRAKRRHAMGNGQSEATITEDSRLPEDAEAALVLDDHSTPGRKGHRQTLTLATCLAPIPMEWLAEAGLGEVTFTDPAMGEQGPLVTRQHHYAERLIVSEQRVPVGDELRQALALLIRQGQFLVPAGEHAETDIEQWRLYLALGHAQGDAPDSVQHWLETRLAELGVEEAGDEALLDPEDLAFEGIPEWERERFDRQYPRRLSLGDLVLDVSYEPNLRRITLDRRHGTRKAEPKRWELPAWQGWKVRYRQGSRVVDVR